MRLGRLHDISLKWKLLIPFLFLAAMGATALFLVSYHFQASLIHVNEERRLRNLYQSFLNGMEFKTRMAMSLAYLVAENPEVAEALAGRDRGRLIELLHPAYLKMHEQFGIKQFHFHIPPATSFLRLHALEDYGQKMEKYRPTINLARETRRGVGGLERGVYGFGIRSVVPVFHGSTLVGTVEFGMSFGKALLDEFKGDFGVDLTLYQQEDPETGAPMVFASTITSGALPAETFRASHDLGEVVFYTSEWEKRKVAVIVGPIRDFSSNIVAVLEIGLDRGPTLALLNRYGAIALAIGLAGLVLSISFVWFVSIFFTRRIKHVVDAAEEIAGGKRDARIAVREGDELGVMARAINKMLTSLEESRMRVKVYADNLERMVEQRTRALMESEQSYRTLVEHVPLVVYFVMADGTAVFLNRFVEQIIGVSPQTLSGHHELWTRHIHPDDSPRVLALFQACLANGREFECEYRMVHSDGHDVYVWDLAVPVFDKDRQLVRMDGIVLDVTARKELQEKIVQADELETLSQVSARLAHEIRNPLTSIGGLTRRLLKSFPDVDPRRPKGEMIVEAVERLEKILEMMTAYIEPKEIQLRLSDLNDRVLMAVDRLSRELRAEGFEIKTDLDRTLPRVRLDEGLFEKILMSLMENAYYRMQQKGRVEVVTGKDGGHVNLTLSYELPFIADDDIDHFFYPFVVDYPFQKGGKGHAIMDVPICKVLIHKHRGIIHVSREKENTVKINISLPAA